MNMSEKALIWHNLAQKARLAAQDLRDDALRQEMLMIAARYEAIARRAEAMAEDRQRQEQQVTA